MNYFLIPGLKHRRVKKIMPIVYLNKEQNTAFRKYAKTKRLSESKVIKKALMAYGVILTMPVKPKKQNKQVITVYYDIPRDNETLNIATTVCNTMGVDIKRVYCNRRHKQYTMAKHCLRYWLKQKTDYTLELIGLFTCQTDHSTVVHSIRTWSHMIETNSRYNDINDKIKNTIKSI